MKKVLIITFHYPPTNNCGAIRLAKYAKYLPDFGWEPIILTVSLDLAGEGLKDELIIGKVYRVNNERHEFKKSLRQKQNLLSFFFPFFARAYKNFRYYPEREIYLLDSFVNEASKIIESNKIDLIFSSSFPITSHIVAAKIKQKYNLPWLAEYRDLWSINNLNAKPFPLSLMEKWLEKKTMVFADAFVTVSQTLAGLLTNFHHKKTYVVANGYDKEDIVFKKNFKSLPKFVITYTGTTYNLKRNPKLLFQALSCLISEGVIKHNSFIVRFIGSDAGMINHFAKKYGIEVEPHDKISHEETLYYQSQSHVLLLLNFDKPYEKGILTTKVYEYMSAQKPILGIGYKDEMLLRLFDQTKTGAMCDNLDEVLMVLRKYICEYQKNGKIAFNGDAHAIGQYNRKCLTQTLANLFNEYSHAVFKDNSTRCVL